MPTDPRRIDLTLSSHGRRRAADRGFTPRLLASLIDIADREVPVGRGCVALSASGTALTAARAESGAALPVDRLRGRVLVVDGDGVVVTALIASHRAGRRYRRTCRDRRRPRSRCGAVRRI